MFWLLRPVINHPLAIAMHICYVQFDFMLNSLTANELNYLNVLRLFYAGGAGCRENFCVIHSWSS
jgi:hypothetical protein